MTEVALTASSESRRRPVADFLELSKSRIVFMVLLTTMAGFLLAASAPLDVTLLLVTLAGTGMVAAGTNALNQIIERDLDARMERTKRRPLPAGRMTTRAAVIYAVSISVAGVAVLAAAVNVWSALLAVFTLASYLFVYTPLKQVTWHSTVIGAVPGAIPPLIGWAAARGTLDLAAWIVFGILFLWQMPHFFAIGWLYRADYARAGFAILSVNDEEGRSSGIQSVIYSAILLIVGVLPWILGYSGVTYAVAAAVTGAAFLWASIEFARSRTVRSARMLFLISILYLPVVMTLLVIDGLHQ